MSGAVGARQEIAGDRRGEGKSAAARDMRLGVRVGTGIALADPAVPGTDLGGRERRAALDHVPGRADAEHESDDEGTDEIGQRPHRMGRFLFAPRGGVRRDQHKRIWQGGHAIGIHR